MDFHGKNGCKCSINWESNRLDLWDDAIGSLDAGTGL